MYAVITDGFNLVFRWMGIWLTCNLVMGVIFRVQIALEQRQAQKSTRRPMQHPSHLPAPRQRQKPEAAKLESMEPEDAEVSPDNAEQADTDADGSENE